MEDKVFEVNSNVPAIADDTLLAVAKMAESRIDAVIKIKQLALKVTNARDWNDQQGNPYLQVSGAEKIANLFNISWGFLTPEPLYEQDDDGHYTYTFQGRFSLGGRTAEFEGSRSSRDSFFKQNLYKKDADGKSKLVREKTIDERDNKRDVKMAALTNLLGNGITRILGIRNLTWEDLEMYAGIKKEQVSKVEYKNKGDKPPLTQPGKKSDKQEPVEGDQTVIVKIGEITSRDGKKKDGSPYTIFTIFDDTGTKYGTFDTKFADLAKLSKNEEIPVNITYTEGQFGRKITNLVAVERTPGDDPID